LKPTLLLGLFLRANGKSSAACLKISWTSAYIINYLGKLRKSLYGSRESITFSSSPPRIRIMEAYHLQKEKKQSVSYLFTLPWNLDSQLCKVFFCLSPSGRCNCRRKLGNVFFFFIFPESPDHTTPLFQDYDERAGRRGLWWTLLMANARKFTNPPNKGIVPPKAPFLSLTDRGVPSLSMGST